MAASKPTLLVLRAEITTFSLVTTYVSSYKSSHSDSFYLPLLVGKKDCWTFSLILMIVESFALIDR